MKEPRVFILTLLAVRVDLDDSKLAGTAGASSILTVQISSDLAEAEGWQQVHKTYPHADGWFDHQVTTYELPNSVETDGYQVQLTVSMPGGM